ncbi:Tyrosine recombinase XerC [Terrisporobacter petrolearius]|uniref:Tyrosine recombinase XerC n=1 Tax=Terrisporobacter petrolearius TaxID=1460447 RepID=A0ABZ3FDX5_9FIRM
MNGKELITRITIAIGTELNLNYTNQNKVMEILQNTLVDYTINKKETMITKSDITDKIVLYLQAKKIEGVADTTIQNYFYLLRKFSSFTTKQVRDININDLREFITLESKNIKQSTINMKITYIQNFFKWLVEEEIIEKDPSKKLPNIKVPKKLRNSLTIEELERLRLACETTRERALIEFLVSTGCRLSELVNINIEELNFNDNSVVVTGKGNKQRLVYFNEKTKLYIENYLNERRDSNKALFVYSKKPYSRLKNRGVEQIVHDIGERAKLDKSIFPHLFRHTFASIGLRSGINIVSIQTLLGHTSVMTTERYIDVSNENIKHEYYKHMIN